MVAIVVIAILASIAILGYKGFQRRATSVVVQTDLTGVQKQIAIAEITSPEELDLSQGLTSDIKTSKDTVLTIKTNSSNNTYLNLTPVQNGVLFYNVCEELIADSQYSTIHSKDGNDSQSVVMKCDDNISAGSILITGWNSKTWTTPVQKSTLENYIASVPYDSWWTDRQTVVRGFYQELINRFEAKGGTFPITSFWDPWANQWSGVKKEELPEPTVSDDSSYCLEGYHSRYPDDKYHITNEGQLSDGPCD